MSAAARTRWPRAPEALPRWTAAAEVAGVFALIVFYAWGLRGRGPFVGVVVLLVLLSHAWRRETPAALGFRPTNFGRCVAAFGPVVAVVAAMIVAEGRARGAFAHGWPERATPTYVLGVLVGYCAWGLVQQWALCGYFYNRLAYAFGAVRGGAWLAALAAAACFAAAHLPNAYLVGPTFALGFLCALGYRKYRNLVFLGLAHGLLGSLLVLLVASSLPQGLRTGPDAGATAGDALRRRYALVHQVSLMYCTRVPSTALDLTRAAALFHALSDPTRLAIVERLRGGEHCVCDLQDLLDAGQSRLSFHLRVLKDAGLVTDRKESRWSYYALDPVAFEETQEFVAAFGPAPRGARRGERRAVAACCK